MCVRGWWTAGRRRDGARAATCLLALSLRAVISDYVPRGVQVPVRVGVAGLTGLMFVGLLKMTFAGPGECGARARASGGEARPNERPPRSCVRALCPPHAACRRDWRDQGALEEAAAVSRGCCSRRRRLSPAHVFGFDSIGAWCRCKQQRPPDQAPRPRGGEEGGEVAGRGRREGRGRGRGTGKGGEANRGPRGGRPGRAGARRGGKGGWVNSAVMVGRGGVARQAGRQGREG